MGRICLVYVRKSLFGPLNTYLGPSFTDAFVSSRHRRLEFILILSVKGGDFGHHHSSV